MHTEVRIYNIIMYLYNNNVLEYVEIVGSEPKLGCLKNTKSLKSQAPQGFSGCLDINNDEMNSKKKFVCIP